jgi:hypothetical protein
MENQNRKKVIEFTGTNTCAELKRTLNHRDR